MKFCIINGPNINMIGIRETEIYGKEDYQSLERRIGDYCKKEGIEFEMYQSNHEGDLVDKIQSCYKNFDGIIINPAAYTHTSIAILDALLAVDLPTVEVHISDPDTREEFRKTNFIRKACIKTIKGQGLDGYIQALQFLKEKLS